MKRHAPSSSYRLGAIAAFAVCLTLVPIVANAQVCTAICESGRGVYRNRAEALTSRVSEPRYVDVHMTVVNPDGTTSIRTQRVPQVAAVSTSVLWSAGETLGVLFMNWHDQMRLLNEVERCGREWEKYANLRLVFSTSREGLRRLGAENANVRISFKYPLDGKTGGSSLLGKASSGQEDTHSMQLILAPDTDTVEVRRVALHEFGHALGYQHEHMNPINGVQWKQPDARNYYRRHTGWSNEEVERNIFRRLSLAENVATTFDRDSIMCYSIPASITLDGYGVRSNTALSYLDTESARIIYPTYESAKLGLTVGIAPGYIPTKAMIVIKVRPGSSATRVRVPGDPTVYQVEPWDLVTRLNDTLTDKMESFREAERKLLGNYRIQILDHRTNTYVWDYGLAD